MAKFRKKPVVIEAIQWDGEMQTFEAIADLGAADVIGWGKNDGCIHIATLEGTMLAERGDWIIKGVRGEFYPCKPDIFDVTYEPA